MKPPRVCFVIICVFCVIAAAVSSAAAAQPDRQVAITIDDLPAGSDSMSAATISEMTSKLLGTLRDQKVPVVGFVNERKLYKFGEVDGRIKALKMWLDYGFELGNYTFTLFPRHPIAGQPFLPESHCLSDRLLHRESRRRRRLRRLAVVDGTAGRGRARLCPPLAVCGTDPRRDEQPHQSRRNLQARTKSRGGGDPNR